MAGELEELVLCRDLPPELRLGAAALAYDALPAFYEPLARDLALDAIASDFQEEGSEVFDAEAAVAEGEVQGMFAGFPAEELAARQRVGLHHLLASLPPEQVGTFVTHLRAFSSGIPPLPAEGRYLARLAVIPSQRGSGLADLLLERFLTGDAASLHVRADNARAITFYTRHGFRLQPGDLPYAVMLRP